jgi:cardiolipin synthase
MQPLKFLISSVRLKSLAKLFWVPQLFTGLRLLAGPLVLWTLLSDQVVIAFWLVCVASLTDWLDGYSARYLRVESNFGKLFDPIADKVFIAFVFIAFIFLQKVPLWLSGLILLRDLAIMMGGLLLRKRFPTIDLKPTLISKQNTFMQMTLAGWLLLTPLLPSYPFYPLFNKILIYGTLLTTVLSSLSYVRIFIQTYRTS